MIRRTVPQVERKDFFSDYGKTVSFIAEVPSVSRLFLAGLAVYEASDLTVGNHTITASYSGDSHYKDSTNSWLQNVNKICSQISMNILQSTMVGARSMYKSVHSACHPYSILLHPAPRKLFAHINIFIFISSLSSWRHLNIPS
ncbi:Ig-like domain-containing protein [Paenibacillus sp. B-A-8]|uniref:Ig-like domain-containing protein n=1 Tax=Paenibacillus sp. B-A-8 TaxID=3400419 RepID=UPI003B024B3E